jgi:hypothetical protein
MLDKPFILACLCGNMPEIETASQLGRMKELNRVVCACGQASPQWSLSVPAAIRLWNRFVNSTIGRAAFRLSVRSVTSEGEINMLEDRRQTPEKRNDRRLYLRRIHSVPVDEERRLCDRRFWQDRRRHKFGYSMHFR